MRPITSLTNTDAPDAEFPLGRVRDREVGQANGTPVNEAMLGDVLMFVNKLMSDSEALGGDPPNDLPESDYNGYQINAALNNVIEAGIDSHSEDGYTALALQNNWANEGSGTFYDAEYYRDPFGFVHLRGHIKRSAGTTGENVTIATFGASNRPLKAQDFTVSARNDTALAAVPGRLPVNIRVNADGTIVPFSYYGTSMLGTLNNANDYLCLDGISYKAEV